MSGLIGKRVSCNLSYTWIEGTVVDKIIGVYGTSLDHPFGITYYMIEVDTISTPDKAAVGAIMQVQPSNIVKILPPLPRDRPPDRITSISPLNEIS